MFTMDLLCFFFLIVSLASALDIPFFWCFLYINATLDRHTLGIVYFILS